MQYKEFKDGISLSRLGLGTMRLPLQSQEDKEIDYAKAKEIVDVCMVQGVNYYDTAYIYHGGKSESFLGKALAEYPRDTFFVADKYNFQTEPDYQKQFAQQLERLNMDRIDFYLLHGIQDHFAEEMTSNGCIAYFDEMKQKGKIRCLGFSFHGSGAMLRKLLGLYPWDFVQIQLNYYDWYCEDAKELYDILKEAEIPVMVMEPVHGGLLANLAEEASKVLKEMDADASQASWAMRWVMDLDQVQVVLSGMSTKEQVEDNIKTFSQPLPLPKEHQIQLEKAAKLQYASVAVACTGCRYCCPDCPSNLDIPALLKYYNAAKIGSAWRLRPLKALAKEAQPESCIGCGSCTDHCPQGFAVPQYMQEMQRMMADI